MPLDMRTCQHVNEEWDLRVNLKARKRRGAPFMPAVDVISLCPECAHGQPMLEAMLAAARQEGAAAERERIAAMLGDPKWCAVCQGRGTVYVGSPGIDEWSDCFECEERAKRAAAVRELPTGGPA